MSSADLQRETGYGHAALSEMQAVGVITQAKRGFWPAVRTMGAIIRRLKERNAGNADRERKNKAEADEAEMRALESAGKLCPMDAAKQFWSDARIEVRQTIERAAYLTPVQKTRLLAELAALKPQLEIER